MMVAARADGKIVLPFLDEDHLGAGGAFVPQRFGGGFLLRHEGQRVAAAVDPAHAAVSRKCGLLAFSAPRSEEHTSELQSLMRTSYAVSCLKQKTTTIKPSTNNESWQT